MEALVKVAGTSPALVKWLYFGVVDLVEGQQCTKGELSVRNLTGKGHASNRGILHLLGFKHDVKEWLRGWAAQHGVAKTMQDLISGIMADHVAYRDRRAESQHNQAVAIPNRGSPVCLCCFCPAPANPTDILS